MLVDADGVFARASSGALLLFGSSWVAEWCGKGLAVCVLCELGVAPDTVLGFVADNVSATFGADGGGGGGALAASGSTRYVVSMLRYWRQEPVRNTMCRHNTTPFTVTSLPAGKTPLIVWRATG